jgi:hypothetical protein
MQKRSGPGIGAFIWSILCQHYLGPFALRANGMQSPWRYAPPKLHRVFGQSPETRLIMHKISTMKMPSHELATAA